MRGYLSNIQKGGAGGWYVNGLPIHPDDIERFVFYKNGKLIHKYEGQIVDYLEQDHVNEFYGKSKVAKLDIRGMKIKQILNEV